MGLSSTIVVREAVTGDAGAVLKIHRGVLEEQDFFITLPNEFKGSVYSVVQYIRAFSKEPCGLFLVALDGEEIKGFLTVRGSALSRMCHTGKLEIMVDSASRGLGIGRALMTHCMEWARNNEALEKLGLSVFTNNERAIALYKEMGFEQEGLRRREYRLRDGSYRDDVLMYCFVD